MAAIEEFIPRYTYEDYKNWEGKWEIINGIAYAMSSAPVMKHQEVSANIWMELKQKSKNCKNCKALMAVDWKIDEKTTVCPDNVFVCGENIGEEYLIKPPKIIFEVLSPSTAFKDRNIKSNLYAKEGVEYYILVDSSAKVAEIFKLKNDKYEKVKNAQFEKFIFKLKECEIEFDFENVWV